MYVFGNNLISCDLDPDLHIYLINRIKQELLKIFANIEQLVRSI
jgi:hypothetical protein